MAITNYTQLKDALQSYCSRTDTAFINQLNTFIDLAEAKFNRELRTLDMETAASIATVANQATVNLPADYLDLRSIEHASGEPRALTLVSKQTIINNYAAEDTGRPVVYTLNGATQLRLGPVPDGIYTLSISYLAQIPELSNSQTTNWLLHREPGLYLNACLYEAWLFLRDQNRAAAHLALADSDMKRIKDEDGRKRKTMTPTQPGLAIGSLA